jgi:hypothetical protein
MSSVITKTPHQIIDQTGISSQWEGSHIRFPDMKFYHRLTSDRLHICNPSAPPHPNEDRLFVRKNHRTQNRRASKDELLYSLSEYLLHYKPYPKSSRNIDMKLIDHTTDATKWLRRCTIPRRSPMCSELEDFEIILIMQQVKNNEPDNWYKVVLKDNSWVPKGQEKLYILRSICFGNIEDDYKPLKKSNDINHRIDHSTLGATHIFWKTLYNILS